MKRRSLARLGAALLAAPWWLQTSLAQTAPAIGVLMMHGKNPGNPQDPNFNALKSRLEREGMTALMPDMPWSRTRYLDGNWDQAMAEIAAHVKTLRERGARKIILIGHSMGCPAALSFAARGGDVQGLVLVAPGHAPHVYYTWPALKAVRESIDEARALVAAGKGDTKERFEDINQGRQQPVIITARNYLSYFDPSSDAEMSVTAPRVPAQVPSMVVIGNKDPLFRIGRSYLGDKLTAHPKNQYLEIAGDHYNAPVVASDAITAWIQQAAAD